MNGSRRRFVFIGVAGAAALVAARMFTPVAMIGNPQRGFALSPDGADIMRALVPALLDGALPDDSAERGVAVEETVTGVATAIDGLPPVTRDELATLFALLALGPVRIMVAGIDRPWREAGTAAASAFLARLQKSRWPVKRAAYDALHQLTFAAWYANPRTWPAIGYPGPPRLA